MEIKEFIASLEKSNFSLAVENGKLILKGDRNKLSREELDAIKANKDVIDFIKENKEGLIEYVSAVARLSSEKKPKDITSIYRLSGLQQGMLFHGLSASPPKMTYRTGITRALLIKQSCKT